MSTGGPRWTLLRMALATVLAPRFAGRRRGYFIPYRYAHAHPHGATDSYAALEPLFTAAKPAMREFIGRFEDVRADVERIGGNNPPEPRWDQLWFPRLDALAAYAMTRRLQPKRIVEVGSGHSTRFLARAVRDGELATEISAIDPAPRAAIAGLPVTLIEELIHEAPARPIAALSAGDILFIDSSHILMPGSDVDFLFNRVLPALPAGVVVHVHDVFLPDGYPAAWAWRGYNEQLGVAALLQGGGYEILFASHYAATRLADEVAASVAGDLALPDGAHESSLWLRKLVS